MSTNTQNILFSCCTSWGKASSSLYLQGELYIQTLVWNRRISEPSNGMPQAAFLFFSVSGCWSPNCQSHPSCAQALQGLFAWIFRSRNPLTCSRVIMEVRKLESGWKGWYVPLKKRNGIYLDGKWWKVPVGGGMCFNNALTLIWVVVSKCFKYFLCSPLFGEDSDFD